MNTSSTQKTEQTSAPWSVQQPYLQSAFGQAATTQANANTNTYNGNQVAQFTPDQLSTFQKMIGYGGSNIPQQTADASGTLASSGTNALTDAMAKLNGFTPQGGTQANIAAATEYANNPATDGMITAAMRDATRSVSEGQLPQIARDSAISGNTMSSRRGISEGIVERGLADKTADVSSQIRGQQFQTGLQLAEQNSQANNSNILDALKASAAAGGSAVSTGINGLGSAITQQGGLFDIANAGGAGQQASGQAAIDNSKGMSEYANDSAWQNLQNFYNIIGGQNWGGTSTGTQTSTPSIWSTIGGLMSAGGSLMKSDRRVKENVKRIGTADNGLPIYTFNYTDDPYKLTIMGLMAQDVAEKDPKAVKTLDGVMHVNYDLALVA